MAFSRRFCTWFDLTHVRHRRLGILVVLCSMFGTLTAFVHAETVTFGFETNIASVTSGISFPDSGIALPFNPEISDRLIVEFTFEPASGSETYFQNQQLLIQIEDFVLQTTNYDISVGNNRPEWIPLSGRIADPANAPIDDRGPGGVRDDFSLACNVTSGTSCGTVPGAGDIEWRVHILLAGDSTVLNADDLTADLDKWNAMSFREMSLLFVDIQSGRTGSLGAFIGAIREVPEPPMAAYIFGLTVLIGAPVRPRSSLETVEVVTTTSFGPAE